MTKKQKILQLFEQAEWTKAPDGSRLRIITYEDFSEAGLLPTKEYREKYCDVVYARNIFRKMGYRVLIGAGMYIIETKHTI